MIATNSLYEVSLFFNPFVFLFTHFSYCCKSSEIGLIKGTVLTTQNNYTCKRIEALRNACIKTVIIIIIIIVIVIIIIIIIIIKMLVIL